MWKVIVASAFIASWPLPELTKVGAWREKLRSDGPHGAIFVTALMRA